MFDVFIAKHIADKATDTPVYLYYHDDTDRFCTLTFQRDLQMYLAEFYIDGKRLYTLVCGFASLQKLVKEDPGWEVIGRL